LAIEEEIVGWKDDLVATDSDTRHDDKNPISALLLPRSLSSKSALGHATRVVQGWQQNDLSDTYFRARNQACGCPS